MWLTATLSFWILVSISIHHVVSTAAAANDGDSVSPNSMMRGNPGSAGEVMITSSISQDAVSASSESGISLATLKQMASYESGKSGPLLPKRQKLSYKTGKSAPWWERPHGRHSNDVPDVPNVGFFEDEEQYDEADLKRLARASSLRRSLRPPRRTGYGSSKRRDDEHALSRHKHDGKKAVSEERPGARHLRHKMRSIS